MLVFNDNYFEKFKFSFDYLSEINYELAEKVSNFVINGIGEPELLLEFALEISHNKAYSLGALLVLDTYEFYLIENNMHDFPFVIASARETIFRNMNNVETNSSNKSLYLLQMENGTVKIGIATNVPRRISQIKSSSGMKVEKYIYTDEFDNAKEKETFLHRQFKSARNFGEYFSVDFDVVKKEFEKISKEENVKLNYVN